MLPTCGNLAAGNAREGLPETEGGNLDSKEIVDKLIVGSTAIDRMKREVESVVRTVLGLIKPELQQWKDNEVIQKIASPTCSWQIDKGEYNRVFVDCLTHYPSDPLHLRRSCYMSLYYAETINISFNDVQLVHEGLSVFVEGMARAFPVLNERWQPLLCAADYAEKKDWKF